MPVDLVTYYTEAGMDYRAWSRNFNMHFGFYRWGMNPLALESMLEEMSWQVFRRLALRDGMKVLDLGCGLGAPTRALISRHDVATMAVTKVEWQLAMARKLSEGISARGSVEWKLGDFTALDLPDGAFQAAFSIEASCHAEGADKEAFVEECSRLLAPGAKLVVADGFMKRSVGLPRWYAALLGYMTRNWAVERFADLPAFCACLERHGLTVLAAEPAAHHRQQDRDYGEADLESARRGGAVPPETSSGRRAAGPPQSARLPASKRTSPLIWERRSVSSGVRVVFIILLPRT